MNSLQADFYNAIKAIESEPAVPEGVSEVEFIAEEACVDEDILDDVLKINGCQLFEVNIFSSRSRSLNSLFRILDRIYVNLIELN
jgi:hypothetical protein